MWSKVEKYMRALITFVFRVLHIKLEEKQIDALIQFIKFGIVGVSNTVLSYVLYVIGLLSIRKLNLFPNIDYLLAQVVAFLLSVLWSFYWNNKYVFQSEQEVKTLIWKKLLKTYISYSFTGLFLNSVLLVLWVQILGISDLIAPIINLFISVPINFLLNKFWAFKNDN